MYYSETTSDWTTEFPAKQHTSFAWASRKSGKANHVQSGSLKIWVILWGVPTLSIPLIFEIGGRLRQRHELAQ